MIIEKYDKFGFYVIRNAFTIEKCYSIKKHIINHFTDSEGKLTKNLNKNYRNGDQAISPMAFNLDYNLDLCEAIFKNKKINNAINLITKEKTIFLHHSDIHVDTVAGKGWDTDAMNNSNGRDGKNWKDMFITRDVNSMINNEKYCVIRAAFYLQDHTEDGGGLFVIAGSHNNSKIQKEIYVKTGLGDVILFDARLKHRGGSVVKKGNNRAAVFWAMGRENVFSKEHSQAAIARQIYQLGLEEYKMNEKLKIILNNNNIGY